MPTPAPKTIYTIRLTPLADSVPPIIRLRHLLKYALRWLKLRCLSAVEDTPATAEAGKSVA